jgi:hypothetical protein
MFALAVGASDIDMHACLTLAGSTFNDIALMVIRPITLGAVVASRFVGCTTVALDVSPAGAVAALTVRALLQVQLYLVPKAADLDSFSDHFLSARFDSRVLSILAHFCLFFRESTTSELYGVWIQNGPIFGNGRSHTTVRQKNKYLPSPQPPFPATARGCSTAIEASHIRGPLVGPVVSGSSAALFFATRALFLRPAIDVISEVVI